MNLTDSNTNLYGSLDHSLTSTFELCMSLYQDLCLEAASQLQHTEVICTETTIFTHCWNSHLSASANINNT